jgi:hypothetical protein
MVQSKIDNPETVATKDTQNKHKHKEKQIHNMCWTPLFVNKHKQKQIHNMCWTPLFVNKHKQNKYTICVGHHYS